MPLGSPASMSISEEVLGGRGGGVGGAPPPRPVSRCRHPTPPDPTLQHICPLFPSDRDEGGRRRGAKPLVERVCGRVARWEEVPCIPVVPVQITALHGQFHPSVGIAGGLAAVDARG